MYRRLGVMFVTLTILAAFAPATRPVAAQADNRCFPETGFCISGRVREFWEQNDGLRVFGLPITPQREELIEGRQLQVQWFERNRLELHPQNARPFDVLLGRLGSDILGLQARDWMTFFKSGPLPGADCRYFPETGHNVCDRILRAWRANGLEIDGRGGFSEAENLSLFGLPLSEARTETLGDGRQYTVQWFERGRFELHPEFDPPNDALLGLLGSETLREMKRVERGTGARPPTNGLELITFESNRGLDSALFPGVPFSNISYIYSMNANGSEQRQITRNHIQRDEGPVWSPNGTKIAFWSPRLGGLPEIYMMNGDGSAITRLTSNGVSEGYPAWSPDGNRIAFASERDGNWEIYVMTVDGFGLVNITNSPGSTDLDPTWSPDGSKILYRSAIFGRDEEIYVMNADGSGKRNLSNNPAEDIAPAWSPDGSKIAFETTRDGNREIYLMNPDGSGQYNISRHPANDVAPTWSPDSTRIAFETNRDGNSEIYVMGADGSGQYNLTSHPADDRRPDWSRRLPAPSGDPCAAVPEPINARVSPARCISRNQDVSIDIFGFLANSRFEYRVTPPGGQRSAPLASSTVNEYGERTSIRFPAGSFSPGLWRVEFTFFSESRSFYGSTIYIRVTP